MRLCYVLLSPTFGMHQYTADLANRMAASHEVHLVTVAGYYKDRYSPDIRVHTPIALSNTGLSAESLSLKQLSIVAGMIVRLMPDLVHFTGPHLWNVAIVGYLRRKGIPVLHTIHDFDPHQGTRLATMLHLWNGAILRTADHILVHGECYRQRMVARGFPADKISYTPLLHLFLSFHESQHIENSLDISYEPFALFFGRFEAYKGLDPLLEAFARLDGQNNWTQENSFGLVMAGSGRLPETWAGKIPPMVEWCAGIVDDRQALKFFQTCAFLILPYTDATQSALIGAAYYFYKPVVVTRVGALPEYVLDGRTGIVIEPGDPEALASAVNHLDVNRQLMKTMGRAGRDWYDVKRSQELESLEDLYQRLGRAHIGISDRRRRL